MKMHREGHASRREMRAGVRWSCEVTCWGGRGAGMSKKYGFVVMKSAVLKEGW